MTAAADLKKGDDVRSVSLLSGQRPARHPRTPFLPLLLLLAARPNL